MIGAAASFDEASQLSVAAQLGTSARSVSRRVPFAPL
jgi:hypothetical protein